MDQFFKTNRTNIFRTYFSLFTNKKMPEGPVINVISRIMNFTRFGKRVVNWHSRKNEKKVGGLLSFVTCLIAVTKNGFESPTVAI